MIVSSLFYDAARGSVPGVRRFGPAFKWEEHQNQGPRRRRKRRLGCGVHVVERDSVGITRVAAYGLRCPDNSVSVKLTDADCAGRLNRKVTSMLPPGASCTVRRKYTATRIAGARASARVRHLDIERQAAGDYE